MRAPLMLVHALHGGRAVTPDTVWGAWSWEPWVITSLVLASALYASGAARMRARTRPGRGVRTWQLWSYAGGTIALILALVSPLDAMGSVLFSAHMVQHTVLLLLAPPLLVAGAPLVPMLWALPPAWRRAIGRTTKRPTVRRAWRVLTRPAVAWLIHAVALWAWHLPTLYEATITSDLVHAAQHASFLGSALLFWWVVLPRALPRGGTARAEAGVGMLMVFTTAIHSGALGALLTLASRPWYPAYAATVRDWGLTLLEDQQLAGLIMWIPPSVFYLLAALVLFALWLGTHGAGLTPGSTAPALLRPTPATLQPPHHGTS